MGDKKIINDAYELLGEEYYEARKKKSGISYFYNELLEFPTTKKLIGSVKGKKVLDLGCGHGMNAKKLYDGGAMIKGIDLSKNLIRLARKEVPKAEFLVGDVEKLPYKNKEFDVVYSSLVLGHLKDWNKVLKEVSRVLKDKGIFVFSNYNPITEEKKKVKWFFKKFTILKGYFNEGRRIGVWAKDKEKEAEIVHYHKTYGTIIRLLVKSGFEIIDYEDCKPTREAKEKFPEKYERTMNYPHFSVWKVRKKG